MKKTDWTEYYKKERSIFSTYTQRYTYKYLCHILRDNNDLFERESKVRLAEFGGGNSCFAETICRDFNIDKYTVVDNNPLACKMSAEKGFHTLQVNLINEEVPEQFNIVMSFGLIEHFTPDDRSKIISKHFLACMPEGLVIMTFPTPTRKYRFIRKCMEIIRAWQFYDEMPFWSDDIIDELQEYGEIVFNEINKDLPLTQTVVAIRKR